jgi:putative chitinase
VATTPKTPTDPKAGEGSETLKALVAGCKEWCPRCHALLTEAQMTEMFPSAPSDRRETARNAFNECFENFELIRCLRKAHLFAQILGESGAELDPKGEDTRYTRKNIKALWPSRDLLGTHPDLGALADAPKSTRDGEAIANRVYAGRNGNGDVASGDGWRFRGHGYIQITGKTTFEAVQQTMDAKYPGNRLDIVKNGDEVVQPRGGMISAMAYWYWKGLNTRADAGDADATVDKITRRVRGGTDTTIEARRQTAYHTTMQTFKTPECVDRDKPSSEAQPWLRSEGMSNVG